VSWYLAVLRKYADFSGRARRKEYWMFALVNFIIGIVLGLISGMLSNALAATNLLSLLYALLVLIPSLAVGVRRLHDTGRSGWWLLIAVIPLIGAIVLLIFTVQDSEPGHNVYGPNPKGALA